MQKIRTLLLLGSSLTALAVARATARKGLRCVMLDNHRGPAAGTRAAEFRKLNTQDMASIRANAHDFIGRDDVAVIADSDRWLRFVRSDRKALVHQGWLVLHPDEAALDVCLDKTAFLAWCETHQLSAPRLYDAADAQALQAPFALIVRPEATQHSSGIKLPKAVEVREPQELAALLQRYATVGVQANISQSLLSAEIRQYSVGAARNATGEVVTFLAEKVRPDAEQCAGGTFVRPAQQRGITELAVKALDALDFFGIAEVEVLFDPERQQGYLIEINARPWLQYGLPFAGGCDLLGHVFGKQTPVGQPGRPHAWLYFSSDLYACFSKTSGMVTTRKLNLAQYLSSLRSADLYALWDWRDPLPWVTSTWNTIRDWVARRLRLK